MLTDANKGITSITYNHLNLPTQVTIAGGFIQYIYDALGTKLKKTVSTGGNTEYAGNYIYENNTLQFFSQPEGYVNMSTGGNPEYVYQYKDHLGNIRLSYSDANADGNITVGTDPMVTEIVEENNYYPFGLKHKGFNEVSSALGNDVAQKWKFGGKELDESLDLDTYDFGARNYDPALGRWMNIDPLAEDYMNLSPYVYTLNNPVLYIDPDGARVEWGEGLTADEKQLIGYAIYQLRKNSKSFDKAFTTLHESKSVFKVGEGQLGGSEGIFFPADKMVDDLDENGQPKGYDEFGIPNQKQNPNSGGDIILDLNEIGQEGLEIEDTLPEEFAHAYQYLFYTEGDFDKYGNIPAGGNYEYEGQMMSGIFKSEAGLRLHPLYGSTRAAESNGINFSARNFGTGIESWYNREDNFYRTGIKRSIDKTQPPSALLKLVDKNDKE